MRLRLVAAVAITIASSAAPAIADVIFLSNQLRPVEEAQKVREVILKGVEPSAEFIADDPGPFLTRLQAEAKAGKVAVSLAGTLHSDVPGLVKAGIFQPLDDILGEIKDRKLSQAFLDLGKFGTSETYAVPWMQASYILVVNKKALPYLPAGADPAALTYKQLAEWGEKINAETGERRIGFPAGPKGLMHRVIQGYLYPSYTGGLVTPFRSPEAQAMWTEFRDLWKKGVNPRSTAYNFMQEPLLADEVWIAIDHTARVLDALNRKPDEFLALPAPSGPKGKGHMPVVAGLMIPKGAPDRAGAVAVIKHLTKPETQATTLREVGFFPVSEMELPSDLPPGTRLIATAINAQAGAKDSLVSLLPVGLGDQNGQFNKVFTDTFQRIVLRGEDPAKALETQAEVLKKVITEANAACWQPDMPSEGPCPVN